MGKFIQRSLLHRRPNLLEDLWNFLSLFPDCHNTCWHPAMWHPSPRVTDSVLPKTTSKLLVLKPNANSAIIILPDCQLHCSLTTNPLLLYLLTLSLFWPSPCTCIFCRLVPAGLPHSHPDPMESRWALSSTWMASCVWGTCCSKADYLGPLWMNIFVQHLLKDRLAWPTQKSQKPYSSSDTLFRKQTLNYLLVLVEFTSSPQLTSQNIPPCWEFLQI